MSKEKSDLTLKIFALAIAIVLWSYVMSEVNPERPENYRNISISFNNMEALDRQGLVLMEPKEATVTVRVTGRKSEMAKMSKFLPEAIKASVDLSGYGEGQVKVPVNVTLEQFGDVRIERWEPSELLFTFDRKDVRDKIITIKTEGELEDGYILGNIKANTQTIVVRGPRSWINQVAEVVALVNLDGRKENAYPTLPVKLLDQDGNEIMGLDFEPSVIEVEVPVYRTTEVPIELILENELDENMEIVSTSINPSRITLRGNNEVVNLASIKTKPIDINSFLENPSQEVELDFPSTVSLADPNEKIVVNIEIQEIAYRTFEFEVGELNLKNLSSDLKLDLGFNTNNVSLTIKGNKDKIEDISKEDFNLSLDLLGLTEGEHLVYLGFNLETGLVIKELSPQPINIKLIKQ